jgi:hypothetical protein
VVQELQMGGTGNERRGDGHETLLARAGRPAI